MDPSDAATKLLDTQDHMTVATADAAGRPWVSPVFFVRDPNYGLYWVSSKTAVHSANIRARPEVCIVVFVTGPAKAIYVEAQARELQDEGEILEAIPLLAAKPQPTKFTVTGLGDVTGDNAWRIYKARPKAAWTRADADEGEQAVTIREPVSLP